MFLVKFIPRYLIVFMFCRKSSPFFHHVFLTSYCFLYENATDFYMLTLYSATTLNLLSFLVLSLDFLVFSSNTITLHANSDGFNSLLKFSPWVSFPGLLPWLTPPSTVLNNGDNGPHSYLASDLHGNTSSFFPIMHDAGFWFTIHTFQLWL